MMLYTWSRVFSHTISENFSYYLCLVAVYTCCRCYTSTHSVVARRITLIYCQLASVSFCQKKMFPFFFDVELAVCCSLLILCLLRAISVALYLVKRGLGRVMTGGELFYVHIDKFIEDTNKPTDIVLQLSRDRNPVWTSELLTITSVNRFLLLSYIHVAYVTDYMYRKGNAVKFPHYRHKITKVPEIDDYPRVKPFINCQLVEYQGYFFFIHRDFEDRSTSQSSIETGNYLDPRGMEVSVTIHPPFPLRHLDKIGREEIRFVGLAYKKALTVRNYDSCLFARRQPWCLEGAPYPGRLSHNGSCMAGLLLVIVPNLLW
eukprot:GHVQ01038292.1.p2 GENE.GHVQ01038292.1~~GHVQ01038292.1.p2  ORF type:complete len:317 (+),score=17.82 GHVQ01038292.1:1649-2599(+)